MYVMYSMMGVGWEDLGHDPFECSCSIFMRCESIVAYSYARTWQNVTTVL